MELDEASPVRLILDVDGHGRRQPQHSAVLEPYSLGACRKWKVCLPGLIEGKAHTVLWNAKPHPHCSFEIDRLEGRCPRHLKRLTAVLGQHNDLQRNVRLAPVQAEGCAACRVRHAAISITYAQERGGGRQLSHRNGRITGNKQSL